MPNIHKPDREPIGIMLPRTTMVRLRKHAHSHALSVQATATNIITAAVQDEVLTSDDYANIAHATKQAERTKRRTSTVVRFPAS